MIVEDVPSQSVDSIQEAIRTSLISILYAVIVSPLVTGGNHVISTLPVTELTEVDTEVT